MTSASSKKYKLHSAANDEIGKKPICAFFASESGCRNGANCKFSHGPTTELAATTTQATAANIRTNANITTDNTPATTTDNTPDNTNKKKKKRKNKKIREIVSSESSGSEMDSPFVSKAASQTLHVPSRTTMTFDKGHSENEEDNVKLENSYSSLAMPAPGKRKNSQMIANPKSKKKSVSSEDGSLHVKEEQQVGSSKPSQFSFRALNLPVAPPPAHLTRSSEATTTSSPKETNSHKKATPTKLGDTAPVLPLPKSTADGKVWLDLVKKTQSHQRFNGNYNFLKYMEQDELIGYASNTWVKTTSFAKSKAGHPQVVAIDCEMCEAADPVSAKKDARALCRVSVIDVATDEVLLDTLVKPMWPVTDYRDWINGINAESLEKVQFTLRHAQAFMMKLCSEETVIIGHAIQNDLAALRIEHYCCVDSALLYKAVDSERATVALRDLAKSVLGRDMPQTHDSINDARVAIACVEHFRKRGGDVEAVVRTPKPQMEGQEHNDRPVHKQLFIHRIPGKNCNENHLEAMFLEHTNIRPDLVDKIEYNEKGQGRTHVHFASGEHAKLAFDSLHGKAETELSGRLQKNIYLRDGNYIRVRMMVSERK